MKNLVCFILWLWAGWAFADDLLLLCGWDEVFAISVEVGSKQWSWRAVDRPEIPEELRGTFGTTDEVKPVKGGAYLSW